MAQGSLTTVTAMAVHADIDAFKRPVLCDLDCVRNAVELQRMSNLDTRSQSVEDFGE